MTEEVRTFDYTSNEPTRLDVFLTSVLPEHSRSYLQGLIRSGMVSINDSLVKKTGYKLDGPQQIIITLPPIVDSKLIPEAIPLDVIYEDENLIVLNKSAGMVVHPSAGHDSGTLVHAILAHAPELKGVGGVKRPGIVHRLDKDTSGLLVVAKNDHSHRFLQKQFKQRKVEKKYYTLVDGQPPTPTGRVEAAINRDSSHRQKMAIVPEHKGRMAVSEYRTIESFPNHTLLEVDILTGRTHQIRLHMAFLKCPVVGDRVYGQRALSLPVERQLLHAHQLKINLPDNTTPTEFNAPLPKDFKNALTELRETK
jgi:23S rRNA pseudouridine1911/1915/1917 synthase